MKKNQFNKRILILWIVALMTVFTLIIATSANALADTTRPTILYISPVNDVSPANNELDVGTHALITLMFSEDMNPSTINTDTFTVMQRTTPEFGGYTSQVIDGTVKYNNHAATFTPNEKFTPDQQYGNVFTVMITTGAKDLAGNSLIQDYVWSFTTGDNPFNTGTTTSQTNQSITAINRLIMTQYSAQPMILYVSPANIEENLSRNELITVVFSKDMNPSTINTDTFTVMQRTTPEFGGYRSQVIDGTVKYNNRAATFTPSEKFTPDQQYGNVFTVMITTGAKDLAGNSLIQDYVWSFTTGDNPFNTGTTTSQQNQNLTAISGSAVTSPSTAAPVTGTQAATASKFPWMWAIGGLFLLILIAIIASLIMTPTSQKNKKIIRTRRTSPFGDVHPVIDIEGIGPKYSKGLQAIGINNTKQLWEADAAKVARVTGAPVSSVKSWQNMAELASVKDIGPQYAELLERSGVHTIDQLKSYNPDKLLNLVREKQDSLKVNIQGNSPGHATVENWIDEARDHKSGTYEEREKQTA
jgi:predicted flap endonuclease-1-like 5' DNA nuclease